MSTTKTNPVRKRLAIAMTALAVVGVGGIASQAGFNDDTTLSASATTGTVSLDSSATETLNWSNLKGNAESDPETFTFTYDGSLDATVTVSLTDGSVTDDEGPVGKGYEVRYSSGEQEGQASLSDGAEHPNILTFDVGEGDQIEVDFFVFVPNDDDAQGDTVSFVVEVDAVQR